MNCSPKPHWSTGSQLGLSDDFPVSCVWVIQSARRRMNQACYWYSIGIYSHLQAVGVEYAVRIYPTLEKGDPRSKLSKARNIKMQLPPLSNTRPLRKHINQVCYVQGWFFLQEKNRSSLGRYSESRHPQIHLLLRFYHSADLQLRKNHHRTLGNLRQLDSKHFVCWHLRFFRVIELCGCQSGTWQQIDETTKMWTYQVVYSSSKLWSR
jgi:hypothetical protein